MTTTFDLSRQQLKTGSSLRFLLFISGKEAVDGETTPGAHQWQFERVEESGSGRFKQRCKFI